MRSAIRSASGSPPRAWGRRPAISSYSTLPRFTPTCVGTAWGDHCRRCDAAVHPPRAWGRLAQFPFSELTQRFTPTCVGTAPQSRRTWSWWSVHPHVRGDGEVLCDIDHSLTGSPPRAWGRLPRSALEEFERRFTPT